MLANVIGIVCNIIIALGSLLSVVLAFYAVKVAKGQLNKIIENQKIDALKIGEAALILGAGREKKEDSIQSEVGIELLVRVGCEVKSGQAIAKIHYNDENSIILSTEYLKRAFSYSENRIEHNPLIYKIVTKDKIIKYQGK